MRGAIIGDIIGSSHEFFHKVTRKEFDLFPPRSTFTDDTVLTIAVYDALKNDIPYEESFMKWIEKYPQRGYGGMFWGWITSKEKKPYGSKGNGAGMRVSAVGWMFDTEEDVLREAKRSAEVTHNHPEGIESAQAVAMCIYMSRMKKSKEEIREYIEKKFKYDLSRPFREMWDNYKRSELAIDTIPYSIQCFLDSDSFEDSIRNAIALGGDADTLAAITGSISEAYYGLDEVLWSKAKKYLPDDILKSLEELDETIEDIYLDVDGVLLTKEGKQMSHIREFLEAVFSLVGGNVYWLTTHCKDGNTDRVLQHIKGRVDDDVFNVLKNVKGTSWQTFKTDGIDMFRRFLWFDDSINETDYRRLERMNREHLLLKVEDNLDEMVEYIKELGEN
jgi:ADP-ribosylglycohydrolase